MKKKKLTGFGVFDRFGQMVDGHHQEASTIPTVDSAEQRARHWDAVYTFDAPHRVVRMIEAPKKKKVRRVRK